MRLIDADALKAYVNSLSTHPLNEWDTWGVLAAIDKQPTVAAPRWVRCKEEPKEDGDYLTYYVDGYCAVNHWSKGWGWMYDEEAVRYWMPLPGPPKEDA